LHGASVLGSTPWPKIPGGLLFTATHLQRWEAAQLKV
jgi:hypothetical protein